IRVRNVTGVQTCALPICRFFSCAVFLPRDRYTTGTRQAMQRVLLHELAGTEIDYTARIDEAVFAQVHFTVHSPEAGVLEPDTMYLQQQLDDAMRSWSDRMVDAVRTERRQSLGAEVTQPEARVTESAAEIGERLAKRFPDAYRADFTASQALADLNRLAGLTDIDDIDMCCYTPSDAAPGERRFKLFLLRSDVTLSRLLPQLQLMGVEVLDQRPYELRREDGTHCWIYDFGLSVGSGVLDGLDEAQEQRLWER